MSLHDSDFAAAGVPALFAQFGSAVTITPAGGDPVSLTAILGPEDTVEVDGRYGKEERTQRRATITTDPDGEYGGVAAPSLADRVTISSVEWGIDSIETKDASTITLRLVRIGVVEMGQSEIGGR